MKNKKVLLIILIVVGVIGLSLATSYALFNFNVTKNTIFKVKAGKLELSISDTNTEDRVIINNLIPTQDSVAVTQNGYNFTITNTGTIDASYTVYLDDVVLQNETRERLSNDLIKVNLSPANSLNASNTTLLSNLTNRILATGTLNAGASVNYTLRVWLIYSAGNEAQNKYFASRIRVDSTQKSSIQQ